MSMSTPHITTKQLEILLLLYRFRFLNRHHIQKMLHHKTHSLINSWLRDLTDKRIIGRIYSVKLKDNTIPAIYHLDTKAVSVLIDHSSVDPAVLKKAYRDRTRSEKLRQHCLLIADIYLKFLESTEQSGAKLEFYTRSQFTSLEYMLQPAPDAYIGIVGKENIQRYFLEVIDSHVPRFASKYRMRQYFDYHEEEAWQEATGKPFPGLMVMCPDDKKLDFIHSILQEENAPNVTHYLTTSNQLQTCETIATIWHS